MNQPESSFRVGERVQYFRVLEDGEQIGSPMMGYVSAIEFKESEGTWYYAIDKNYVHVHTEAHLLLWNPYPREPIKPARFVLDQLVLYVQDNVPLLTCVLDFYWCRAGGVWNYTTCWAKDFLESELFSLAPLLEEFEVTIVSEGLAKLK